jgi:hypothetical protein
MMEIESPVGERGDRIPESADFLPQTAGLSSESKDSEISDTANIPTSEKIAQAESVNSNQSTVNSTEGTKQGTDTNATEAQKRTPSEMDIKKMVDDIRNVQDEGIDERDKAITGIYADFYNRFGDIEDVHKKFRDDAVKYFQEAYEKTRDELRGNLKTEEAGKELKGVSDKLLSQHIEVLESFDFEAESSRFINKEIGLVFTGEYKQPNLNSQFIGNLMDYIATKGARKEVLLPELVKEAERRGKSGNKSVNSNQSTVNSTEGKKQGEKQGEKQGTGEGNPRMQAVNELESVNNTFNEQLQQQIDGVLPKGHVYKLGMPSDALLASGIENLPIEMPSGRLETKSNKEYKSNHPFELSDVENLPEALANPIAVFESETDPKRSVVLTELQSKGDNFMAIIDVSRDNKRNRVNSLISLYPKGSDVRVAKWFDSRNQKEIGRDLLKWVDKEKALNWLSGSASNVHSTGLSTKRIANIIQNFGNPTIREHISQSPQSPFKTIIAKKFYDLIKWLNKTGLAKIVIVDRDKMREYLDNMSHINVRKQQIKHENERGVAEAKLREAEATGYIDTGKTDDNGNRIVIVPKYTVSWYYADNTNPDTSDYSSYDEAMKALEEAGDMDYMDEYFDPYNEARIFFDTGYIDEEGEVEITEEAVSMDDIDKEYVPDYIYDLIDRWSNDVIGNNSITNPSEKARNLESEVYSNINSDIIEEYKGLRIEVPFTSKYRHIDIYDKNDNLVDSIELRIADHPYNPANNDSNADSGKFISVEVFEKDKTDGRFNGKYSLQFSGSDSYNDIVEDVNERVKGIIDDNIDDYRVNAIDGGERFMKLWHGSPSSFKAFSTLYIGTGEGAQAFGHGLYFTERKDIAKWYAEKLKPKKYQENVTINNLAKQALESANGDVADALKYQQELLLEDWSDKKRVKATIKVLETGKPLNEGKVNLYEVNVDDELNFMRWDQPVTSEQRDKIISYASRNEIKATVFGENDVPLKDIFDVTADSSGQTVYEVLSKSLGGQKAASEFLLNAGIDGIQYPAESTSSKSKGGFNYVVFDEDTIEITDKIRFMFTPQGDVYGFVTQEGVVYLDPDRMNANTPIHEFGHLWNSFIKENFPELWAKGKELILQTDYWKKVINDPAYSHLSKGTSIGQINLSLQTGESINKPTDEAIDRFMDEALAMAIGNKGEAVWNDQQDVSLYARIKGWLYEVWNSIREKLGVSMDKGGVTIENMTLEDFTDRAVKELLGGKSINSKQLTVNSTDQSTGNSQQLAGNSQQLAGEKGNETLGGKEKNNNFGENNNSDEIPERISQEKSRSGNEIHSREQEAALYIAGRIEAARAEQQGQLSSREQEDLEKRAALDYAKEKGLWTDDLYSLGTPFAGGGNENTLAYDAENRIIYKSNNLFNSRNSISNLLESIKAHNLLFPETKYELVGFTGIDNGPNRTPHIEPVFKQDYIPNAEQATPEEISRYMKSLGFDRVNDHAFTNGDYTVSDLRPRNVLKDAEGRIYVVDDIIKSNVKGNGARTQTDGNDGIRFQTIPPVPEPPEVTKNDSFDDVIKKHIEYVKSLEVYKDQFDEQAEETSNLYRRFVDKAKPLEAFQDSIVKAGGKIDVSTNAYDDYTRSMGRGSDAFSRFGYNYMKPLTDLMTRMRKSGKLDSINIQWNTGEKNTLSAYDKMSVYLQAKDIIEGKDLDLPDRGYDGFSEMISFTNSQRKLSPEEYVQLFEGLFGVDEIEDLWKKVRKVTEFSLRYELDAGYITKETYDRYVKAREFYVPQRQWRERDLSGREDHYLTGRGVFANSPYNAALIKAKGRGSLASDPVAFMQSIAESAILSVEKNNMKKYAYRFAFDNQDTGRKTGAFHITKVWYVRTAEKNDAGQTLYRETNTPPDTKTLEADKKIRKEIAELWNKYGQAQTAQAKGVILSDIDKLSDQIQVLARVNESLLTQRTNDEKKQHRVKVIDEGVEYAIEYADERVAQVLNGNFEEDYNNWAMQMARQATSVLTGLMTQYNPSFAATNIVRDIGSALVSNQIQFGTSYNTHFVKNLSNSQGTIWKFVKNKNVSDKYEFANTANGKLLDEFFADGAATGYSYLKDIDRLRSDMGKAVDPTTKQKIMSGAYEKTIGGLGDIFAAITEASELTTRFAVYKTSRQMGYTREQAATHAKEVTSGKKVHNVPYVSSQEGKAPLYMLETVRSVISYENN